MKKIIIYAMVLLMLISFVQALDLSNYPSIFIKSGKFDAVIVIGEKAPAEDVIAASDIISSLQQLGILTGSAKLSNEIVDINNQNLVAVGNACTNQITAKLLGNPQSCWEGLSSDKGVLRLTKKNGYYQLLVGGSSPLGTRNAASVLSNYKNYNLMASEMQITKNSQGKFELTYIFDLSSFPNMFVKDGNLNTVIVVGDKASSLDVIAQSNLILFFGEYLDKQIKDAAKLASEITTLNQNIISIGNPCDNNVSAQITGNPQPCNKYFEKGKASIRIYKYGDYLHLVVAGYTDQGTKEAVDVLTNYNKYSFSGNEFVINVQEASITEKEEEKNEEPKEEVISVEEEKQKIIEELNEKIMNKSKGEERKVAKVVQEEKDIIEETAKQEEKPSFLKRIINWITSLFK